jgi:hypothetical protein
MLPNEVFALACRAYYEEQGLIVDETNGQFAHSPWTRKECDTGYYLLWGHHQHQGLIQSKDLNKCCFFSGDVIKWLRECDYFPEGYFELWDTYEKYSGENGRKGAEVVHKERDEFGRSLHALRSLANTYQGEKDERGVPIARIKNGERLHKDKDESGRSVAAMKTNSQVWESTVDGFRSNPGAVAAHNRSRGWDPCARVRIQ